MIKIISNWPLYISIILLNIRSPIIVTSYILPLSIYFFEPLPITIFYASSMIINKTVLTMKFTWICHFIKGRETIKKEQVVLTSVIIDSNYIKIQFELEVEWDLVNFIPYISYCYFNFSQSMWRPCIQNSNSRDHSQWCKLLPSTFYIIDIYTVFNSYLPNELPPWLHALREKKSFI